MLLIWDIHINRHHQHLIIEELRDFVGRFPEEKHIVFVGDYVYHFTYDRVALLELYRFFLQLYGQGKSVYILAGNHDWLAGQFVYEEGRATFEIIPDHGGKILFITQPQFVEIEGKSCLFFPFFLPEETWSSNDTYKELIESDHPQERISGRANSLLTDLVEERRSRSTNWERLVVIHHRYIVGISFPGQFARFSYKSPWLAKEWCAEDDLLLVSWHLHKPFVYQNYFCTGSIWPSSPLEFNQAKYGYRWRDDQVEAYPLLIKAYCQLSPGDWSAQLSTQLLQSHRQSVHSDQAALFGQWVRDVHIFEDSPSELDPKRTVLFVVDDQLKYEQLEEHVAPDLFARVADIKIKRKRKSYDQLQGELDSGQASLQESIADWKWLLHQYIQQKFGEHSEEYFTLLREMKIL